MSLEFQLTFAGVPFVTDDGIQVPLTFPDPEVGGEVLDPCVPHDSACTLMEQVDRMIPFHYLQDMNSNPHFPGRNLGELAYTESQDIKVRVGDWFYPTGASRWSVFRGLATSSQAKAMLASTGGYLPKTFVMKAVPSSPGNTPDRAEDYTISTSMYLLPPRPLGEDSGDWDGLYLITLVDERYFFQGTPTQLSPKFFNSWDDLLQFVANDLDIVLTYDTIPEAYGKPEPDSHLWAQQESGPLLLDALALNLGRVVVRKMDGSYKLETYASSQVLVETTRSTSRHAGGDLFYSGNKLPVGSLAASRNTAVPERCKITFPYYVRGDDPVPHFLNPRHQAPRPSHWLEDSYGQVYTLEVPVSSGGTLVSGLVGTSDQVFHNTAKALIDDESQTNPVNVSGLTALGLQMAEDFYGWQVGRALDEVYEGTLNWEPEGFHDVVWTYSCMRGGATTRVMKSPWNQFNREFQHSTPVVSGYSQTPKGVGGPSVALNIRDQFSGHPSTVPINTTLTASLTSGGYSLALDDVGYLPTNERWKGLVSGEMMLFEGTSGGTTLNIVQRGVDGTVQTSHLSGSPVTYPGPNQTYGVNLMTFGRGQYAMPAEATSGGITGVRVVPQTQTVGVISSYSGSISQKGRWCWEGRISSPEVPKEFSDYWGGNIYVIERDDWAIRLPDDGSPGYYDGQFAGWTNTTPPRPLYMVDCKPACCQTIPGTDRFFYTQVGMSWIPESSTWEVVYIPTYVTDDGKYYVLTTGYLTITDPPPLDTPLVPSDVPSEIVYYISVPPPSSSSTSTWTSSGYTIDTSLTIPSRDDGDDWTLFVVGHVTQDGLTATLTLTRPNSSSYITYLDPYNPEDPLPGRPGTQLTLTGPRETPPSLNQYITYHGPDDDEWSFLLTVGELSEDSSQFGVVWGGTPDTVTTSLTSLHKPLEHTTTYERTYPYPNPGFRFTDLPALRPPEIQLDFQIGRDPNDPADPEVLQGLIFVPGNQNLFILILGNDPNNPVWRFGNGQNVIGWPVENPGGQVQFMVLIQVGNQPDDDVAFFLVRMGDYQPLSYIPVAPTPEPTPDPTPGACTYTAGIPTILYATVTGACRNTTLALTWDEIGFNWTGTTGTSLDCDSLGLSLSYTGTNWVLDSIESYCGPELTMTLDEYCGGAFTLMGSATANNAGTGGSSCGTVTVVITETAP